MGTIFRKIQKRDGNIPHAILVKSSHSNCTTVIYDWFFLMKYWKELGRQSTKHHLLLGEENWKQNHEKEAKKN